MNNKPVALIGIGEMGGVFAKGLLKIGYPVYPILRDSDYSQFAITLVDPLFILIAVGESELHTVFRKLPNGWRNKLVLLQNELLPNDWQSADVTDPTVISVWFEKKKGMDVKVLQPSPIYGPNGGVLKQALDSLQIPTVILSTFDDLISSLVKKNLFVLTINISGLLFDITIKELLNTYKEQTIAIAVEILAIQEKLVQISLDHDYLLKELLLSFASAPDHKCRGRSASERLNRTLALADHFNLTSPVLKEIGTKCL